MLTTARSATVRWAGALRTRTFVGWVCVAVVAARLVFLTQPLRSDEGGYLFLARHWRTGGEFLYGDYHVDRPPLLMAIFRVAALTDWDGAIRLLSIPFAVLTVAAVARSAFLVAGDTAARWAAVVAAAMLVSPALAADQADGELFATPFVAGSVALALDAWRRPRGAARWGLAVGSGVLAGSAVLVKQNFLDGLVFVAVLLVADSLRRRRVETRSLVLGAGVAVGVLLPNLAAYGWAHSHGLDGLQLWTDLGAFRKQALEVILSQSTTAPLTRAWQLLGLALVSAMVPLLWTWGRSSLGRVRRLSAEEWAVTLGLAYALTALLGGGSYWAHYLIGLVPMLALGTGMLAARGDRDGRSARRWARVAAGSASGLVVVMAVVYATTPWVWFQQHTGEWLAASSEPGDTAVVLYGSPSILETADLTSPYPYLWSLPMRTLDPDQERLRSTLAGPEAPTWVVEATPLNSWHIDESGRLRALLAERYERVTSFCGLHVWLLRGVERDLAPPPRC
ncbi:MAG TPA: hypothetical protein PLP61_15215 [Nocardioides sp.]|uniref:hypothetical protein n=1 Tax=Nocardioides sp. TaxID=35761 RepID=UPI002BED379D|nr:hypothetical protein [Nocardioides sp.]HQR28391.1 hypothetical protein [Nocardioides sp.]